MQCFYFGLLISMVSLVNCHFKKIHYADFIDDKIVIKTSSFTDFGKTKDLKGWAARAVFDGKNYNSTG